jgi:transposase
MEMSKQPMLSIPLDLPDVRVLKTELSKQGELIITVESTLTTTTCQHCGRVLIKEHAVDDPILLRHLPILGHPVYIRIRPKRFRCPDCDNRPTTTQRLSWYEPRALHTIPYERHLLLALVNSTVEDVVRKEDVSYDAVLGVLDAWIATSIDWDSVGPFAVLGIDEIALLKGHRDFIAVITAQLENGEVRVLALLPDRLKATVVAWLKRIPQARRSAITTVCTDLWEGYITATQEVLPHATIVADRFHVARLYRDCADRLRKETLRSLRATKDKAVLEELKHTLWPFRKGADDLEADEQARLERLFERAPALKTAYELRQDLTTIFDTASSRDDGLRQLQAWERKVAESGLDCFDSFLSTLATWREQIANYFIARQTSGFVEGVNNKLKVIKRRCYGLTNLGRFFQRITLDLMGEHWFSPWRQPAH